MSKLQLTKPENLKQAIVLLVIATGVCLMTFFYQIAEENEFYDNFNNQANMMSSNLATSLLYEDIDEINEILDTLQGKKEIVLACVFDAQGTLITSKGHTTTALHCDHKHIKHASITHFASPIQQKSKMLGQLELYVSQQNVYHDTIRFLALLILTASSIWAINAFAIRKLTAQIKGHEKKLQQVLHKQDDVINAEHRKIAIEIHDQIGQLLSSANLNIRYLKSSLAGQQQQGLLGETEQILSEVYVRIKNISTELHPAILSFGIQAAVEWLAEQKLSPNNIEWRVRRNRELKALDQKLAIILFRICQEAFTNILKYSHASIVFIDLNLEPHSIVMTIRDNGIGARASMLQKNISLGLIGITERAKSVNGEVTFDSNAYGTSLSITLPIQEESHGKHH